MKTSKGISTFKCFELDENIGECSPEPCFSKINDIVDEINCNIKLFADDTILYVSTDDHELSAEILNDNVKKIRDWANQWLVTFNPGKTKLLNVTLKKEADFDNYPIFFDDIEIPSVKEHKHLGIWFDHKLKW